MIPADPHEQVAYFRFHEELDDISSSCDELQDLLRTMARTSRQGATQPNLERTKEHFQKLAGLCKRGQDMLVALEKSIPVLEENFEWFRTNRIVCPQCQGEGLITERKVILKRIPCPKCRGKGRVCAPQAPETVPDSSPPSGPEKVLRSCRGLSQHEKTFLKKLLAQKAHLGLGASTKRLRAKERKTQSTNAAFSRMLLRLEKRRLIVRSNQATGVPGQGLIRTRPDQPMVKRTSHVILTPLGKAVAEQLQHNG
jgi:hypothetical protein